MDELQTLRINALEREARRLLVESVGEDRAEELYPSVMNRVLFENAVNPDELDIGEIVREFTKTASESSKLDTRTIDQIIEETLDREIEKLRNDIEKLKSKTAAKLSAEAPAAKQLKGEAPAAKQLKGEAPAAKQLKGEAPAAKQLKGEAPAAKQLKGEAPAPKVLKAEKRVTLKGEYYPCYVVK